MIIAVDGPVAAGKGTLARRLARHFGFAYLDTGLLYRAVGARLLHQGADPDNAADAAAAAAAITAGDLADPRLREESVAAAASRVAAVPQVRAALLDFQRRFARTPPDGAPGAVLDGRDIGTVVCPDADIKLFVTASPEVRARRRYQELAARGEATTEGRVLADLVARDARDAGRADAPLAQAPDAHLLDTTNLDIEAAFAAAVEIVSAQSGPSRAARGKPGPGPCGQG